MTERRHESLSPALKLAALAGKLLPASVVSYLYRLGPFSRLLRSLLTRSAPAGLVEVEIAGGPLAGRRMQLDLRAEKDIWLGAYEAGTLAALAAIGRPGMVAYDIGANLGYVTIALARICGPAGHVVAFEPLPQNLERLRANLALNDLGSMVTVEPRAVGSESGAGSFLIHRSPGMGKLEGSHGRDATYPGSLPVEVVALDDYVRTLEVPPPDLIKLDVEGGEGAALLGMRRLLREVKPTLLIELHGEVAARGCWEALQAADYLMSRMPPSDGLLSSPMELDRKAHIVARPQHPAHPMADSGAGKEA